MKAKALASSELPASLGGQFRRHLPAYGAGALMLAAFQFAMNRIDWLSKDTIDRIFGGTPETAWQPATFILGLSLMAFVTRVASRYFIFNAGRDVEYEMRAILLDRLHRLGAAFYRKMSSGEIMSRSTSDLIQVRLLFGFGVLNVVNVAFAFASALQVMVHISLRLTLVSFVGLPFLMVMTRRFSRALFTRTRANQDTLGKLSDLVQANLAGVRLVKSFGLEDEELLRFRTRNREYLGASLALARLRGFMGPMVGATSAFGIMVFFWYGGALLLAKPEAGGITPGAFFAFWLALGRMTWPMIALGFSLAIVQRGRAGFSRLKEIFDAEPEVTDGPDPAPASFAGALSVKGLSFEYGERRVLDDVSFDVPAGGSLAIVGPTGSGKSTLAMLLARLLPTPKNTVFLDDRCVCRLPLASVRAVIGYAQQDAFLFSSSVEDNIAFSLPPETSDAHALVRAAAREAQVADDIADLPDQFDTVVGERGVQLSGGQKQRVALARALAREPKILVLDDPLSAVDAKTEAAILDAIERQALARTVLLVTHRVAAAARCSQIIVLDHGRIVERGAHDELLARDGLYAAFAEEQMMQSELQAIEADPETIESLPPTPIPAGLSEAP